MAGCRQFRPDFVFTVEGAQRDAGDELRANFRSVSPGFFATLGVPLIAGRDFSDADRNGAERVVVISSNLARRLFPSQDSVNRHLSWTDGRMRFIGVSTEPRRIVGVVADIGDEAIGAPLEMTVYHPFEQEIGGGRLFVHTATDPYALVPTITRTVRELAADQPVERAGTLEDIRAEVLAPSRLNAIVIGGFAAVALAIAIVGVAGVLAFTVRGRTREFGIRLAVGSQPREILRGVLYEGALMAGAGIILGCAAGFVVARLIGGFAGELEWSGPLPLAASAALLLAASAASLIPAARAARVDVVQALRAE